LRIASLVLIFGVALPVEGCALDEQTIPFVLQDNLVHVTAQLNGQSVSAVLDSGTDGVIVNRSHTSALDVVQGAAAGSALGGGSSPQQLSAIGIGEVKLGPIRLSDVAGFALDLQSLSASAGFPVDALIGNPVFAASAIKIDYRTQTVTFMPSNRAPACRNLIPLKIINGVPIVEVVLRPKKTGDAPVILHLIVDLGTRHFAAVVGGSFLHSPAGQALLRSGRPQQIGTGTGGAVDGTSVQVAELDVADKRFSNLEIALTGQVRAFDSGFADGSLGVPLWKHGAITFDYADRDLCLD